MKIKLLLIFNGNTPWIAYICVHIIKNGTATTHQDEDHIADISVKYFSLLYE